MTKSIDLIRRELHAFCELAQRRGWRIGSNERGAAIQYGENCSEGTCCPMGAVEVCTWADGSMAALFEEDSAAMEQFAFGFDGMESYEGVKLKGPYADLGREFRIFYVGASQ